MRSDSFTFKLLELYGTRCSHRGQWRVHAALRRLLHANVNEDLEVVRQGQRWLLNPSDYAQSEFFWLGEKDAWDVYHLSRLLIPGSAILDVGANFGFYALTFARLLGGVTQIHAFEPFPSSHRRLCTNITLNRLEPVVTPHQLACSDKAGTARMWSRLDNSGASSIRANADGPLVTLTTLDAFCAEQALARLQLVKIDVEGHEERVLRGAQEMLHRLRPLVFIEFDPPKLETAGSSVARVAEQLEQAGYRLWIARRGTLEPMRELPSGDTYVNLFGLHASSHRP